ncbi:hypothetical protein C4K35_4689 [Pseudomonas chlororaphis subsp. piscium]|uniref:hypothetical protein n=1 Tax=Pseudomonas chlororaphis TaxID=587753 RepID=UPI000F56DBD8|nr:hypothetical protein [Pseudomonas chlororaphis]AZC52258.1 hypothetical protein C4K35_4689 [Pseudomonas chlororaphis subsp. piscium]AZC88430.1 hypothetical protein C4K29_2127 [Pseudomonas chlororaphis subsp. piscium]
MAWLRAGTVAVTSGSTTVTGTGTNFAASTRVGDAFIGPDGRSYELANVASATVISLGSPYLGSTATGASYAIMPVNGYQKVLADTVRDWTNLYGPRMAALGTTGNYEILPVSKGGTGGATQADARAGLGLGTAAMLNTGSAVGSALRVGDFGLGSFGVSIAALNNITTSLSFTTNGATTGVPVGQGTTDGQGTGYHIQHDNASFAHQRWNQLGTWRLFERPKNNGSWREWVELYHSRSAVGTVSQASGVPTGALIEKGINSNGYYLKFADGTMICGAEGRPGTFDNATNINYPWTYPIPFTSIYFVSANIVGGLGGAKVISTVSCYNRTLNSAIAAALSVSAFTAADAASVSFDIFAFGRWYG